MTSTEHIVAFVAMAVAILAILVIGTLAAAEIIGTARRQPEARARTTKPGGSLTPVISRRRHRPTPRV